MDCKAKKIVIAIFLILLGGFLTSYGYYQARDLIYGPTVSILSPKNGETLLEPLAKITGKASNISYISLDDRPIYIDSEGKFREEFLLANGYNAIKIEVKDKFGRTKEKVIEVVYKGEIPNPSARTEASASGDSSGQFPIPVSDKPEFLGTGQVFNENNEMSEI